MNKTLLTLLTVGTLSFNSLAQTTCNTACNTNCTVTALDHAKSAVSSGYNYFKRLSLKDGFAAETFGMYHKGNYGGGLSVSTIETNAFNYKMSLAAVQETQSNKKNEIVFYDTALSISYNGDTYVPVVGSIGYYVETGAAVDLSNPIAGIYSQSAAGIKKTFPINNTLSVVTGGGVGYLSKWHDAYYIAHVGISTKLNGKGFMGIW